MKVLIFGAGAVGSVIGGFLTRLGHDVSLVGRPDHMNAIQKNGLVIRGIWGEYRIKALETYVSASELQKLNPEFDYIFLTVKSYDTERAVLELKPFMNEKTVLISLQNGLGNIETILKSIRPEQFLAGRIITGIELKPGDVEITGTAAPIEIGAPHAAQTSRAAVEVAHLLSQAKIPCVPTQKIMEVIWAKAIYNCALNAPCTLLEKPYGAMLESPERLNQMRKIVEECYDVAKRKSISLSPESPQEYFKLLTEKLIPPTAKHFPSMLRDLTQRRKTEINSLNGAICAYGQAFGVPVPANEALTKAIQNKLLSI